MTTTKFSETLVDVLISSRQICPSGREELVITVTYNDHEFEYAPWWQSDGTTGDGFECSCGFHTGSVDNPGQEQEAVLDALHAGLLLAGLQEAIRSNTGYPAQWKNLQNLCISTLVSHDLFTTNASSFLRKASGHPTASQLRKMLPH